MFNLTTFLLLFFFNLSIAINDERQALLTFKFSVLHDPLHTLSNWNASTPLCSWAGVTCAPAARHVTALSLPGRNISGHLPPSLFLLLPNLLSLDLAGNQLSGPVPAAALSSPSLLSLNLSSNNLTGRVPPGPYPARPVIQTLDLSNNLLSGEIPDDVGNLTALLHLDVGGNELTGMIPVSVTKLTELEFLTVASNQISGEIPRGLGRLRKLRLVYLGYNTLSGVIPAELGLLASLQHLDLVYNKLHGVIPVELGNLTNLQNLFLYGNTLHGSIPESIFSITGLKSLDLSENFLSGEIPQSVSNLRELEVLHLFGNNLTGTIPEGISSLPKLQFLQLWSNNFSGGIPGDLGERNNLTVVDLSTNSLVGEIPEGICRSGRLFKLILFSNLLEGSIPKSLGQCRSLKRVRLHNNRLSGELPPGFTALPLVYFLEVSGNQLSGDAGRIEWSMPELQMLNLASNRFSGSLPDFSSSADQLENLDLSENSFSGEIPPAYGRLSELMVLKVSQNSISGIIPPDLGACKKLVTLDLSHNHLSGQIPTSLAALPVLGQLDLSENDLSGKIPSNLGSADSLTQVNLSFNHLYGALPSTGAFLAINFTAIAGNKLCGGDVASGLPPCNQPTPRKQATINAWWFLVAACLLALIAITSLAIFIFKKRCQTPPNPFPTASLRLINFERKADGSIWEVAFFDSKASRLISLPELLSSLDNDTRTALVSGFVVERQSTRSVARDGDEDDDELIFRLGKLRQRNVLRVVGVCRSEKHSGSFLVYRGVATGGGRRLCETLHGLSWERRKRAVVGVARAIKYLHRGCSPPILAGELSSERVVVDSDGEACLMLGLSTVAMMGSLEPKWFASSPYIAPETRETKLVTDKNDIYGFGIMVMEVLSGKSPTEVEPGGGMVAWARHCYSECHLDAWIDPSMKGRPGPGTSYRNQMVEMMSLALHCTADDPNGRPSSGDLLKSIECIFRTSSCVRAFELSSS